MAIVNKIYSFYLIIIKLYVTIICLSQPIYSRHTKSKKKVRMVLP